MEKVENSNLNSSIEAVYQEIFNNVLNNYKIVFHSDVSRKVQNLNFDFSAFGNEPLTSFITESDSGKILINGVYYEVDKNLFKVLNIAAYEFLYKAAKQYELSVVKTGNDLANRVGEAYKDYFVKSIKKELKLHYNTKRILKDYLYEFYFDSKQDYINSCVNSAILNACLLILAGSNIYYDYAQINKSAAKEPIVAQESNQD